MARVTSLRADVSYYLTRKRVSFPREEGNRGAARRLVITRCAIFCGLKVHHATRQNADVCVNEQLLTAVHSLMDSNATLRPCLYGLGYLRQPSPPPPRVILGELTFH